jgi:anaerobic selenocysteine-containing dehydrogenase
MTDTALMADIVLPATMFLEHDDIYRGGGHQHVMLGPKLIDAPGECWTNHQVIAALAQRVGAAHRGFAMAGKDIVDETITASGYGSYDSLKAARWLDIQVPFRQAHYLDGFAWPDGKFRFKPDWPNVPAHQDGMMGPWQSLPVFPDHWDVIETADAAHPFKLVTAPARNFLNSSFNETPGSRKREGEPSLMLHPDDAKRVGVAEGALVTVGNQRGELDLKVVFFAGIQRGVVIAEGLHANGSHKRGEGINVLTGADQVAPFGGAAFHDNRVWLRVAKTH